MGQRRLSQHRGLGRHGQRARDPTFVDSDGWDYHIGPGSAAVDAGVEVGVETDIDGDPQPPGRPPDIGADERELRAYLLVVLRD